MSANSHPDLAAASLDTSRTPSKGNHKHTFSSALSAAISPVAPGATRGNRANDMLSSPEGPRYPQRPRDWLPSESPYRGLDLGDFEDSGDVGYRSSSSLPMTLPELDVDLVRATSQNEEFDMSEPVVFDARKVSPSKERQDSRLQSSHLSNESIAKDSGTNEPEKPSNSQLDSEPTKLEHSDEHPNKHSSEHKSEDCSIANEKNLPEASESVSQLRIAESANPQVSVNEDGHASCSQIVSVEPTPPTVTFAEPTPNDHKTHVHKKTDSTASHIEYHQDAEGHIEKLRVYDDNGNPVDSEDQEIASAWQTMPTVGSHTMYDDRNNVVMDSYENVAEDEHLNAAASGYSRVANNDDAVSINSLDDRTDYLFDHHQANDEVDAGFQMAATKSMLTDQQKIAYAGICRLCVAEMAYGCSKLGSMSQKAVESLQVWGRDIVLSLYNHLDLSMEEQTMIESLALHQLIADDLAPTLRQTQRVETNGYIMPEDEFSDAESSARAAGATQNESHASDLHEELPANMNKTIEVDVKWTVMCDLFLVLLKAGAYDSRSRTLLTLIASKLGVSAKEVAQFERKVTDVLQIDDEGDQDWSEQDIIERRRRKALRKKYAYVGLATVGGGLVIGLSAGLLAPIVGAGLAGALGTIGISGTSGFLAGTGGAAIITTASTAIGMRVGSRAMLKRAGHVKTFEFRPIYNNNRVNVIITVGGWMTGKDDDVRLPFSTIDPVMGDVMSVHWEPEMMRSLGQTINILATEALAFGVQQILAATVFTVLLSSLQAPMWLAKLSYLVDNPWSVSLDRAWAAGLILADTLVKRKLGNRPATLVGYGLGARMIYSCLSELARQNQFGLVQDVLLFGTPVFYQKKDFSKVRAMASGRFVNGYSRKDWILAFLFPAAKRYGNVLGLDSLPEQETADFHVENMDVSEEVDGHMSYRSKMPLLMKLCGVSVLSEEFDEIEDPDPDQLREKQRELLGELDTAEKPKKTGFFSSWGFDWMQRAKSKGPATAGPVDSYGNPVDGSNRSDDPTTQKGEPAGGTLIFDADALRSELETLKPRMKYESESMPLPDRNKDELPIELMAYDIEPAKPVAALDYDDPNSPKPPPYTSRAADAKPKDATPKDETPSKIQLQFDNLE